METVDNFLLSIEDAPKTEDPVSLTPPDNQVNTGLSSDIAKEKALKWQLLLGDKASSVEEMQRELESGEYRFRKEQIANHLKEQERAIRQQVFEDLVKSGVADKDFLQLIAGGPSRFDDPELADNYGWADKLIGFSFYSKGVKEPQVFDEVSDEKVDTTTAVFEEIATKQEVTKELLGEARSRVSNMSWGEWTFNFVPSLFSINEHMKMSDILEDAPGDSWMLGGTVKDKVSYLWTLPPEEFKVKLREAYDTLSAKNPIIAEQFLQKVLSYSSMNEFLDNTFEALDLVDIGAAGKGAAKLVKEGYEEGMKEAMRSAVKANAKPGGTIDESLAKMGEQEGAAVTKVLGDLDKSIKESDLELKARSAKYNEAERAIEDVAKDLPSKYNPFKYKLDSENIHAPLARRLREALVDDVDLLEAIIRIPRVERLDLDSGAFKYVIDNAIQSIALKHTRTADAIVDYAVVPSTETAENVYKIEVTLGRPTGQLFDTKKQAQAYANLHYKLKSGTYSIEPKGTSYVIKMRRDVDETAAREMFFDTDSVEGAVANIPLLRRIVSTDNALSKNLVKQRKAVAYSPQRAQKILGKMWEPVKSLSKGKKKELYRVLEEFAQRVDKDTGKIGVAFDSVGEFVEAFTKVNGKPPSDDQIVAYFAYRKILDFDYTVRNLAVRRNFARQGVESVFIKTTDGEVEALGKLVDDLPWHAKEEAGVAFIGKDVTQFMFKNDMDAATRDFIKQAIEDGKLKVIQIANAKAYPFAKYFGNTPIHFAVVENRNVTFGPLPYRFLDYNPGSGHVIYADEFFTKVPVVKKGRYYGDITVATHTTRKEAKLFAEKLDVAIKKAIQGEDEALNKMYQDGEIPFRPQEIADLAQEVGDYRGAFAVPNGLRVLDEYKHMLPDVTDLDSSVFDLSRGTSVDFMQERDKVIRKVTVAGYHEDKPLFKVKSPKKLDPEAAMQRTLREDINELFLEDYKVRAVEDFFRQFGEYVENYDPKKNNLMQVFSEPKWKEKTINKEELAKAKAMYASMKNLWMQTDAIRIQRNWAKQQLLDAIFDLGGNKAAQAFSEHLLPFIKDPTVYLRTFAFYAKLGLFNAVQLLQQVQGAVNVVAHSNLRIVKDSFLDTSYLLARFYYGGETDDIVKFNAYMRKLRSRAAKKGKLAKDRLTDDEWHEMIESGMNSGFFEVGSEYQAIDDLAYSSPVRSGVRNALDKSLVFFKMGERIPRFLAWSVAYREWRLANKGKKLTDDAMKEILNRADWLTGRMSAASKNALQEGWKSVMFQFLTYQMHIAEGMIETAIKNPGQFVQALLVYSGVYGIPGALGASSTINVYDIFREWLLEYDAKNGTDYSNYLQHPFVGIGMKGLAGTAVDKVLGESYDFSKRYGPMGLDMWNPLFDIATGNADERTLKELAKVFIGASGNVAVDMASRLSPFWNWTVSVFHPQMTKYEVTMSDVLNVFETVSTVRNLSESTKIIMYKEWRLKRGETLPTESPVSDAIARALGMSREEIDDYYIMNKSLAKFDREKRKVAEAVEQEIINMWQAETEEEASVYYRRAKALLELSGLNSWERASLMGTLLMKNRDKIPAVRTKFLMKSLTKESK